MDLVRRALSVALMAIFAAGVIAGCEDGDDTSTLVSAAGEAVGPGFPSTVSLVVTSEGTEDTLALLSVDEGAGTLGLVGGPLDVHAPIGDAETIAVDEAARRIYLASDIEGEMAVVEVDAAGNLTPIQGSPFALEARGPTVVTLHLESGSAYVGYRNRDFLSHYPIDPATGALGDALPAVPIDGTWVETMRRPTDEALDDLLYVLCRDTSNILGLRIEPDGALTEIGVNVVTDFRPDYLDFAEDSSAGIHRLYVSTTAGTIDAFDIDPVTGALTRLKSAPYSVPGTTLFELLRASPDGQFLAVGAEIPPSVALLRFEDDGSLTFLDRSVISNSKGGPEGIVWTPNGRFLFLANHMLGDGIYVFERVGNDLIQGPVPRYLLPGRQVDLVLTSMDVDTP